MIKVTAEIIEKITSIIRHLSYLLGYKIAELSEKSKFLDEILLLFLEGITACKSH